VRRLRDSAADVVGWGDLATGVSATALKSEPTIVFHFVNIGIATRSAASSFPLSRCMSLAVASKDNFPRHALKELEWSNAIASPKMLHKINRAR
jgi:hypothetical protein